MVPNPSIQGYRDTAWNVPETVGSRPPPLLSADVNDIAHDTVCGRMAAYVRPVVRQCRGQQMWSPTSGALNSPVAPDELIGHHLALSAERWEPLLQTIDRIAPTLRLRLANRVLVPEQAERVDALFARNRLQPFYGYEVFTALRVINKLAVILPAGQDVQHRALLVSDLDAEG